MADGQIFSGTVCKPERLINFYLPHLHLAALLVVIPSEFQQHLWHQKTNESQGYRMVLFV